MGVIAYTVANAGIRVGNLSRNYAETSKNTMAMQQQYYTTATESGAYVENQLPIQVANKELAEQIINNDSNASTNIDSLLILKLYVSLKKVLATRPQGIALSFIFNGFPFIEEFMPRFICSYVSAGSQSSVSFVFPLN